jgi:hypothetical protein
MAFFKRKLTVIESFERALKSKQAARQKLVEQLSMAETVLEQKRVVAEQLAVAGATNAQLERAEVNMRAVEDRAKSLRAELAEFDEQVLSTERALADAKARCERERLADAIEAMAAAVEQAAPGFSVSAVALVEAVTKSAASVPEANKFSATVDAVHREVLSAADLICWELRTIAVRTRAGNTNMQLHPQPEPEQPPGTETERQLVYTLNPLLWREGGEVRRVAAFTLVGLPKTLVPIALRHQHVDYLNARRVQTLMHVHSSGELNSDPHPEDTQFIDLHALGADEERAEANVA